MAFDITLNVQTSLFEFFVPQNTEKYFLDLMGYFKQELIIPDSRKLPNRALLNLMQNYSWWSNLTFYIMAFWYYKNIICGNFDISISCMSCISEILYLRRFKGDWAYISDYSRE